jgi:hypothetical protein
MKWDYSDEHYPQIFIKDDHVAGLSLWLEKIAELSSQYKGDWNVLIADMWPNEDMTRLIGHVQMRDVGVGYDIGYRVCAYLENGGIIGYKGDDKPLIQKWLAEAASTAKTQATLKALMLKNAFDIRLTDHGEGPIEKALKIKF